MLQSKLFTKTRKESPKDEVSKNANLLIRAGYIHKEMAGVYAYLPLGLKVLEKIKTIVREEMNAIGGQELIMTALQRKELWEQTDRWSDEKVDVWFKSELKAGGEVGFGWSHEEPIADMLKQYISSFRDLPIFVYQFQTKMRNELRAKSGIMRGREFVMKDMYSCSIDEVKHALRHTFLCTTTAKFGDQGIKGLVLAQTTETVCVTVVMQLGEVLDLQRQLAVADHFQNVTLHGQHKCGQVWIALRVEWLHIAPED